jgi:LmbE family N-acetylglucosaminyl deacetylase
MAVDRSDGWRAGVPGVGMLGLSLGSAAKRILAIGCHSDDIEIGCGALLLALAKTRPDVSVTWVVLTTAGDREVEARKSAAVFLEGFADTNVITRQFRDGFLPYSGPGVKEFFEELKAAEPDLIFTHASHDLHQDHRLASELTWNTFRNHLILEYEIPKYDGDLGRPNVFMVVEEEIARRKAALVCEHFATQREKHWFDEELFLSVLRLRGMEAGSPTRYAEAYYSRKLVLIV